MKVKEPMDYEDILPFPLRSFSINCKISPIFCNTSFRFWHAITYCRWDGLAIVFFLVLTCPFPKLLVFKFTSSSLIYKRKSIWKVCLLLKKAWHLVWESLMMMYLLKGNFYLTVCHIQTIQSQFCQTISFKTSIYCSPLLHNQLIWYIHTVYVHVYCCIVYKCNDEKSIRRPHDPGYRVLTPSPSIIIYDGSVPDLAIDRISGTTFIVLWLPVLTRLK